MKTCNEFIMGDIMVTGFVYGTTRHTNDHF
jgi:hypothetical protein